MRCQGCAGERFTRAGRDRDGRQVSRCTGCMRRQTGRSASAFSGYRFPPDVIALAVRWYLRHRLSYADVAELLAERGIHADPSSIYDWVWAFTPLYREAARTYRHPARGKWAIDETYIKVGGVAQYVFRALDERGQVVDVFVSRHRGGRRLPPRSDRGDRGAPAFAAVLPEVAHVAAKPERQAVERGHQHLKGRYLPMRGFKQAPAAQVVCAGHGFMRTLRDGFSRLGLAAATRASRAHRG